MFLREQTRIPSLVDYLMTIRPCITQSERLPTKSVPGINQRMAESWEDLGIPGEGTWAAGQGAQGSSFLLTIADAFQ